MATIGIDIGGRAHVAARCRDGQLKADRTVLRVEPEPGGLRRCSTPGWRRSPSPWSGW